MYSHIYVLIYVRIHVRLCIHRYLYAFVDTHTFVLTYLSRNRRMNILNILRWKD